LQESLFLQLCGTSSIGNPTIDLRFKGVGRTRTVDPTTKSRRSATLQNVRRPPPALRCRGHVCPAGQGFQFYTPLKRSALRLNGDIPEKAILSMNHPMKLTCKPGANWFDVHLVEVNSRTDVDVARRLWLGDLALSCYKTEMPKIVDQWLLFPPH